MSVISVTINVIMIFIYLLKNLFLSVFLFFRHWYWDGFQFIYGKALGIIRALEKRLAIRINFRFLFKPLYQEYNIYGYVLGFLFRALRIITGGIGYLLIMAAAAAIYALWAALPAFALYMVINAN